MSLHAQQNQRSPSNNRPSAMLPSQQSQNLYEYSSSSSGTLYPTTSHDSLSFSSSGPSQLPTDMNAPELLNHNIKLALQCVEVIQRLARSASDGIEHAFHPAAESSPMSASADLASLRQYIEMFSAHLVSTGVGALPMLSFPTDGSAPPLPTETALLEETTKAVTAMYARQKQIQDNNGVVASLLSAPEGPRR